MRQLPLLFLIFSIAAAHTVAQEDFQHEPKIIALVEPYLTHSKVNAVSIGVISNGQVWKKSFGHLDPDGARSPDEKTIYEIGSISKVSPAFLLCKRVSKP